MKTLNQIKKNEHQAWLTTVIIMAIIILTCLLINIKSSAQTWNHLLIEEGYIKVNYKSESRNNFKVKRICKKLNIDQGKVIAVYKYSRIWMFGEKEKYYHKYERYIPVTLDQMNKTKIIFGKERNVLSDKEKAMFIQQME